MSRGRDTKSTLRVDVAQLILQYLVLKGTSCQGMDKDGLDNDAELSHSNHILSSDYVNDNRSREYSPDMQTVSYFELPDKENVIMMMITWYEIEQFINREKERRRKDDEKKLIEKKQK